tara:strand:+ start:1114 stop:1326 length:213 start_codon:yes stop_codon:yes gene_type:complete
MDLQSFRAKGEGYIDLLFQVCVEKGSFMPVDVAEEWFTMINILKVEIIFIQAIVKEVIIIGPGMKEGCQV